MVRIAFFIVIFPVLAACGSDPDSADPSNAAATQTEPATHAFTGARIFDGTGAPAIDDGVVLVRNGVIAAVGAAGAVEIPDGAQITDLEGRWLVPGFINAHGHVNSAGDRSSIPEQLEIYAHYGITTVLSLGDDAERPDERFDPGLERARLFASGPSLSPSSPEDAEREVARVAGMDADWVKSHVVQSRGQGIHFAHVIAAARERSLRAAIHVEELADAKDVVRAGASMVAHSVRDVPVDDELTRLMLERDVCLVPTFTRELSTFVYADRPDFFDDPFFLERSAPEDLDGFLTPQRRAAAEGASAQYWRDQLPLAMDNLRRLHEAGVLVAMGTDTGPSGRFQGYFEHLEMEMMVEAGLTPEEVLLAATGDAARCIGLEGVVGTIRPGVWADLVVLDANPAEDITNARAIYGVWVAGNRIR